jgi:adenine phosphoribosyltransferase
MAGSKTGLPRGLYVIMSQYRRLIRRIYAVRLLRVAKRGMKYKEFERLLGIDSTLLARYVSGLVLPGPQQAEKIIEGLERIVNIDKLIRDHIERYKGYIDLSPLLSDIDLLSVIAAKLSWTYEDSNISKVLVPETSGISLATLIATYLNSNLVVARRRKENPLVQYYERHLIRPPNIRRIFYVRKDLLSKGDRVLVVDDIVHTGYTLKIMEEIVEDAGAELVGVASIVVVGERWRDIIGGNVRVETLLTL